MSEQAEMPVLSSEVEGHVAQFLFDRARPLLLEFDESWQLVNLHGDASFFGIDVDNGDVAARQLSDLFIGMPLDATIDLPFVHMPNGRSAHVHLLGGTARGFQVLLLDAQGEHDRQQAQQQVGNEAALVSGQKTRAIAQLRRIRTELESQRTRLAEANSLKNALIATLSHDFRTPLTSIFGYLHLLEDEADNSESTRHALRALRRNSRYLFTLAENLLEYARADSGSSLLTPANVDLAHLVEDLEGMFRPMAADQRLSFEISLEMHDTQPPVLDEVRLRQVLVNLIANAVRYTNKGGVSASVRWQDAALSIEVRDSGIGISQELHEQIFIAFNRVGQAAGSGAGLGLSIVKRLVAQMHGTIAVESRLGEGSCFRVVLPNLASVAAAEQPIARAPSADEPSHIRTVLVVDDDPDISHLLDVLLTGLGFRVRVVGDANAAVESALADPPDVLLVDVQLPGLSGNTAVFRLRAKGYTGHIVTLSATATEEARQAALNAGADQYLTKPINIELLARALQVASPRR